MKKSKIISIIFSLVLLFPCFPEMSFDLGLGTGFGFQNFENDTLSLKNFELVPIEVPLEFRYFHSNRSFIGFGLDGFFRIGIFNFYQLNYKGSDNYHPVASDIDVKTGTQYGFVNGKGYGYYPVYEKNKETFTSVNFNLNPLVYFRWNTINDKKSSIGIGPSYGIGFNSILFANNKDYNSEVDAYNSITKEKITSQKIGLTFLYEGTHTNTGWNFANSFGLKTTIDFLEKSQFTNNNWNPCFNIFIGAFLRTGWNFKTINDRKNEKIQAEEIAAKEEEQRKINEENRIKAEQEEIEKKAAEESAENERLRKEAEEAEKEKIVIKQLIKSGKYTVLDFFPSQKDSYWVYTTSDGDIEQERTIIDINERTGAIGFKNILLSQYETYDIYLADEKSIVEWVTVNAFGQKKENLKPYPIILAMPEKNWKETVSDEEYHTYKTTLSSCTVNGTNYENCILVTEIVYLNGKLYQTNKYYYAWKTGLVLETLTDTNGKESIYLELYSFR